jgi:hypothetical protein
VEWLKVKVLSSSPSPTYTKKKELGAGCVAQAVEHLLHKSEPLSSNPVPNKRKKKLGVVVYTCNPSTREAKAGRS